MCIQWILCCNNMTLIHLFHNATVRVMNSQVSGQCLYTIGVVNLLHGGGFPGGWKPKIECVRSLLRGKKQKIILASFYFGSYNSIVISPYFVKVTISVFDAQGEAES